MNPSHLLGALVALSVVVAVAIVSLRGITYSEANARERQQSFVACVEQGNDPLTCQAAVPGGAAK